MQVKKGDIVKIISGKDRVLPPAEVLRVIPAENKIVVEGRKLVTKHLRGNPMLGTESRKEEIEAAMDASNVALWSEKLQKGVRTQARYVGQNGSLHTSEKEAASSFAKAPAKIAKVRYCAASEEVFDKLD